MTKENNNQGRAGTITSSPPPILAPTTFELAAITTRKRTPHAIRYNKADMIAGRIFRWFVFGVFIRVLLSVGGYRSHEGIPCGL